MCLHSVSKWLLGSSATFAIYALSTGPVGWIVNHAPDAVTQVLTVPAVVFYLPLVFVCVVDPSGIAGSLLLR